MTDRTWKQGLLTIPGIGVSLLPKVACPLCWPAYAGLLSSLGLGFLLSATYLLPLTVGFLLIALVTLAYRVRQKRCYGPLLLGLAGSGVVLVTKFVVEFNAGIYAGIGLLILASFWNAWPQHPASVMPCCRNGRESRSESLQKDTIDGK
jgi:hypothetical protein